MGIFDKISVVGDNITRTTGLVSEKREFIFKQAINTALLFIILLVFGCLDFMTATFHIEYIFDPSFWATVGSKLVAGVCAFNIGINFMWDTEIKKDLILALNKEKYEWLKQFQMDDFNYYVTKVYNPMMKIKAYLSQINYKITLLNRFSRRKDRLLYSSEVPLDAENREQLIAELEEKKKINKYCIVRQELEDLKDEDFINKNLDSLKVRYIEVDPTIFELEIDGSKPVYGTKTKGSATVGKVKASSGVAAGMLGFAMFTTALVFEFNSQQFASQMEAFWHYLLKCVEDVGVVLWQLFRGMMKTRKIISSEYTQPYAGRVQVYSSYQKWRLDQGKITYEEYVRIMRIKTAKQVEEELQKNKEEKKDDGTVEIEMTEQEYKEKFGEQEKTTN